MTDKDLRVEFPSQVRWQTEWASREEWEQTGHKYGQLWAAYSKGKDDFEFAFDMHVGWWIKWGGNQYGEGYSQFIDMLGCKYSHITNMVSLVNKFPPDTWREGLTPAHYRALWGVQNKEVAQKWLDHAAMVGLSAAQMKREALQDPDANWKSGPFVPDPESDEQHQAVVENHNLKREIQEFANRVNQAQELVNKTIELMGTPEDPTKALNESGQRTVLDNLSNVGELLETPSVLDWTNALLDIWASSQPVDARLAAVVDILDAACVDRKNGVLT